MSQQSFERGPVQPRERGRPGWLAEHKVVTSLGAVVALLAIAAIVVAIVVGLNAGNDTAKGVASTPTPRPTTAPPATSASTTPTPTPVSSSPTASTAPTTKKPTPTVAPKPPASVHYAGRGSGTFRIKKPQPGNPAVAVIYGSKTGGTTITALDSAGRQRAIVLVAGANYHGSILLDASGGDTASLRIQAPGFWSVTLKPVLGAERIQSVPVSGQGDDVLAYVGEATPMKIVHTGSRTFTVTLYGATTQRLVSTTGSYSDTVVVPGSGVVVIHADGKWSIGKV